ncbi:retrovirus-related Pol polyprotein from transposon 17.6 [Trichonephila clavipes]|nr:retrovirus-related Pol polyprotein from transposon 17.6 [Trichonephila clavipes]
MLVINEEIGEILKWCVDRIMVEMIIGVTVRIAVKEISGSRAGIGFKTLIADLTIWDINLEIEVKMTILVEGTKEIGVGIKILVDAVETHRTIKCFERIMSALDLRSGYFQMAVKPIHGKFVNVYMDDVIISSPSFTQHVELLKKVFRLLHEAGITLNNDKCEFGWVVAFLNQEQRRVVFAFRTFSAVERNYTVTDRECLAVVWALNKFRTYLGSLPIKEFNTEWEHHSGTQNTVADVLSIKPIESIIEVKVDFATIRDLVLSSRDQLIKEQRTDPELVHIYRYLKNPEDRSVNTTICENSFRDFRLVEVLLFYAKYATSLGEREREMRVYIPKSLRNEIMREFHDKPR